MKPGEYVDALRLTSRNQDDVLEDIEQAAGATTPDARRAHRRYAYNARNVRVTVVGPERSRSHYLVVARNLSQGGMSFLHGGFIHIGSLCDVALVDLEGTVHVVRSRVVMCRHVRGRVHEIGLRFEEKVAPARFSQQAADLEARGQVDRGDAPKLPTLRAHLLLVTKDLDVRRRVHDTLAKSLTAVVGVDAFGSAVDFLKRLTFDVLCVDADGLDVPATEVVTKARECQFEGPVFACSRAPGSLPSVFDATFPRHFKEGELLMKLAEALASREIRSLEMPIYSELARESGSQEFIQQYVAQLRQSAETLRGGLEALDRERIEATCRVLRSTSGGYGFAVLAHAAAVVVDTIARAGEVEAARPEIDALVSMCERATHESPGAAAA